MATEIDRLLNSLVETVFDADDSKVFKDIEAAGKDPQQEAALLRMMLERTVGSFARFYASRQEDAEKLLTVEQVAARYQHSCDWVYKSSQLKKVQVKVGKCLRWRESDLRAIEANQSGRRKGFVMRQISPEEAKAESKTKVWAV